MLLPRIESLEDYRRIYRQEPIWLPAMHAICDRHSLDPQQLAFAQPGTHVVFSAGADCHIKLFSPLWAADYRSESLVLHALASRSSLSVPRLLDKGEIETWPYVILTTVPGVPLNQVWMDLSVHEKRHIVQACGRFLAELHRVPLDGLGALIKDWRTFVQTRALSRVEQLRRSMLDPQWVLAADRLFESQRAFLEEPFEPVLLCADLTDEHVMVWSYRFWRCYGRASTLRVCCACVHHHSG